MKKTILFFLSLGVSLATWASPIDVETARSIAADFFKSTSSQACAYKRLHRPSTKVDMQLVYEPTMSTRTTHEAAEYYVFAPADSVGFVIVAGDDEVKPIVGYSFGSSFSKDFMPPALEKFLTAYQLYIDDVRADRVEVMKSVDEEVVPVFPFITSTWGQWYPYNYYCPQVGGKSTLAGCLAIATAQIMKYYEWPKAGHGECYAYLNDEDNTVVSTTLGDEYDWGNILDNYSNGYNDTEAEAVGQLVKDVGYACQMIYGNNESYAYTVDALKAFLRNFDYSPDIRLVDRDYYSYADWKELMYRELSEGRPVWYIGQDENGKGGHAFISCGVSQDGKYYINWGWGGWCDGYFDIDALNTDGYMYNNEHQAIINIKPIEEGETLEDYIPIPHVGRIEITEQDNSFATPYALYKIYLENCSDETISGQTGFDIYKDGVMESSYVYDLITYTDVQPGWYWWYEGVRVGWSNAVDMSQGIREIRFFWQPDGSTEWYEPYGKPVIYMLTTEDGHYFSTDKDEFGDIDGIEVIQTDGLIIEPFKGGVGLTSSKAVKVGIYTMNGMLMKEVELAPDQKQICTLPQGIYLVNGTKIVID